MLRPDPYILTLFSNISAKVPVTYLRDLIEQAEWVIIGEVVAIESPGIFDNYGHTIRVAEIHPHRFLRGQREANFFIKFTPSVADHPDFVAKQSYLLFIQKTESGPYVGYLGALKINNGIVST